MDTIKALSFAIQILTFYLLYNQLYKGKRGKPHHIQLQIVAKTKGPDDLFLLVQFELQQKFFSDALLPSFFPLVR